MAELDDTDIESTFVLDKDDSTPVKTQVIWGRLVSIENEFQNIELTEDEVWIGRNKECHPNGKITDKRMSSKHFRILLENNQVYIEDNSSNGTYVNTVKLNKKEKQILKNGDEITLFSPKHETGVPKYVFQDKRPKNSNSSTTTNATTSSTSTSPPPSNTNPPPTSTETNSNSNPTSNSSDQPSLKRKASEAEPQPNKKIAIEPEEDASLEENLTCGICQDVLYKCVSLIPCLHSFCCSCISDWIDRSNECPECRKKISKISKNHLIQNLVDVYLTKFPKKQRSEEEKKILDPKSELNDVLEAFKAAYGDGDSESSSSSEDEDSNPICQQCPGQNNRAPGFVCPRYGPHIQCTACHRQLPNRIGTFGVTQRCDLCHRIFCQLYWGCTAPNGPNTLKKLGDFEFNQVPQGQKGPFDGNDTERKILVDYLNANTITPTDAFKDCLTKLDNGNFKYNRASMIPNPNSQSISCLDCASSVFSELLFEYRKAISKQDLKDKRPDCHYGKNCRTKGHNQQHRDKYNHVCEQTRN